MWRVGDGSHINFWSDCWVPSLPNGRMISDATGDVSDLSLVSSNIRDGRWNFDDVKSCLLPEEISAIKKIHLPLFSTDDTLVWSQHRSGVYSVKSGYQFATSLNKAAYSNRASSSSLPEFEELGLDMEVLLSSQD